jgi:anti-sigma regulatory factor (Ser/Thr protein kinase)
VIDAGLERLARAVEEHGHLPVLDLCDALLAAMSPGTRGFHDDIALVAARMTGSDGRQFVDAFDGGMPDLAGARGRFRAWLASVGVESEEAEAVILAIGEAVANAVEHACDGSARSVITVEASLRDGRLVAAVNDTGTWDEDSTTGPSEGRGRGFTIMKSLMDEVSVRRSRVGTSVRLDLTLGREPARPGT